MSPEQLDTRLGPLNANERIALAASVIPHSELAVSSAFGPFSAAFLHLVTRQIPDIPVGFLDTGYHFTETLSFRDELASRLSLNLQIIRPSISRAEFEKKAGDKPWDTDHEGCCKVNKVDPMDDWLKGFSAWLSGIRSNQTQNRAGLGFAVLNSRGQFKIHPILDWTSKQVWDYINEHQLPVHPLFYKGFTSLGCEPCTHVAGPGEDRSGRWKGLKQECGLHI
ncbi:MAG: phosphoadenylyl-sulfate reductase [Bacteroidetes bacterium]|nr:phosphoadenylyl-sulfate reductase [Bacteroidota bacterium]